MGETSLYTNIPHTECEAYDTFYKVTRLIPTCLLAQATRLTILENSFQFCGKTYLQTHGTAMRIKMAIAFAKVETEILGQSEFKPFV